VRSTADLTRVRDPERREKILRAAAELFAGRGYHAVSLADIGAAAGIVGSGVYRHFASKAAILVALFDEFTGRLTRTRS
jgi:AcrR family transcriptional regulator